VTLSEAWQGGIPGRDALPYVAVQFATVMAAVSWRARLLRRQAARLNPAKIPVGTVFAQSSAGHHAVFHRDPRSAVAIRMLVAARGEWHSRNGRRLRVSPRKGVTLVRREKDDTPAP